MLSSATDATRAIESAVDKYTMLMHNKELVHQITLCCHSLHHSECYLGAANAGSQVGFFGNDLMVGYGKP